MMELFTKKDKTKKTHYAENSILICGTHQASPDVPTSSDWAEVDCGVCTKAKPFMETLKRLQPCSTPGLVEQEISVDVDLSEDDRELLNLYNTITFQDLADIIKTRLDKWDVCRKVVQNPDSSKSDTDYSNGRMEKLSIEIAKLRKIVSMRFG